jgi:hypothetical protein
MSRISVKTVGVFDSSEGRTKHVLPIWRPLPVMQWPSLLRIREVPWFESTIKRSYVVRICCHVHRFTELNIVFSIYHSLCLLKFQLKTQEKISENPHVYLLVSTDTLASSHCHTIWPLRPLQSHDFSQYSRYVNFSTKASAAIPTVKCHCPLLLSFLVTINDEPFKDEAYLFYIRTQCVPRCKHSPLRL